MKIAIFKNFNRKYFLGYFLIAGILFLLDFGPFFTPVKNIFAQVLQPVRSVTYRIGQFNFEQLFYSDKLKRQEKEIQDLEKQLVAAEGKIVELQQLHDENKRLKGLINSTVAKDESLYRPAWIISRQGDYLIINQGEKDKVTVGQLVINQERHLVGRISKTYDQEAKILTIGSVSLELPVLIFSDWREDCFNNLTDCQRTRGIVSGKVIKDILREEKVNVGDIVTLLDGPRGILIGKITQVRESKDSIFKQAEMEELINLDRLTEVFLISQ